jgi:hypothetical protein
MTEKEIVIRTAINELTEYFGLKWDANNAMKIQWHELYWLIEKLLAEKK